jgi:hypothetical protein
MPESDRFSVTRRISVAPADIFAIISDPRGHVSVDGSGMLIAPQGDAKPTAVGDTFVMDMDGPARGFPDIGTYTVTNTVTKFVDDAEFEWSVGQPGKPIGHLFGYQLVAAGDAETDVTHYVDWSAVDDAWRERIAFPVINAEGLTKTLDNLNAVVSPATG